MKANELRIGNWVLVPYPAPVLIPCFPRQIDDMEYYGSRLVFGKDPMMHPLIWDLKHCAGVPLSEEWLIKFGFEHSNNNPFWFSKGDVIHIGSNRNIELQFFPGDQAVKTRLKIHYVHQLQNLYFCLTGEELTLKETT